jgi:hypothetical protein
MNTENRLAMSCSHSNSSLKSIENKNPQNEIHSIQVCIPVGLCFVVLYIAINPIRIKKYVQVSFSNPSQPAPIRNGVPMQ